MLYGTPATLCVVCVWLERTIREVLLRERTHSKLDYKSDAQRGVTAHNDSTPTYSYT